MRLCVCVEIKSTTMGIIKTIAVCMALAMATTGAQGGEKLDIGRITKGYYAAENMRSLLPLADGYSFAQISKDRKQILKYDFSTGQQTGVIYDAATSGGKIEAIDDYTTSPDGTCILLRTNTQQVYRRSYKADHYVFLTETRQLMPLSNNGKQQSTIWAPDSRKVAFVRDNNIFIVELDNSMRETQVTHDGKFNEVINGMPDWVNEEEFGLNTAMAFTADSRNICWIRYDESKVKTYALQLFKGMSPAKEEYCDYPGEYAFKYPKAGQDNAVVTAWSHDITTGKTAQLQLPLPQEGYIPRIFTGIAQGDVVLYTMNRHQDSLMVYSADATTLKCRRLLTESVTRYVKEEVVGGILFTENHILVPSDRDGFMQVYLYDYNGKLVKCLTRAKYGVTHIYGYDEKTKKLYYQAAGVSPIEREVYCTNNKGKTTLLTPRKGWNTALFSSNYQTLIRTWSDAENPYECDVYTIKGEKLRKVIDNQQLKERLAAIDKAKKEFFSFTTSEGVELNGWMMRPADFDATRKYPVIMFQYSGPGSQQVVNSWGIGSMGQGGIYDQYLTQQGFIVVCTDGRGTGGRGADFEKCTYLRIGELEARDQVETALYLASLPYVDPQRIGIWGWSYGGFCTLMSMSEGRGVFRAGVAVAPPTNWKFYDSIYTERFMRTPEENPEGYAVNPTVRAAQMHGALLICHGMADDNVHPQNTFEYSEALVQADKDFREIIYTNRNHSIFGGNTRQHLLRQITQHFISNMK